MVTLQKVFGISICLLVAFAFVSPLGLAEENNRKKVDLRKGISISDAKFNSAAKAKNFEIVSKMGLSMEGYEDTGGLKRIIENHLRNHALDDAKVNDALEDLAERYGIDFGTIDQFEDFLHGGLISIDLVEFTPGWGASDQAGGFVDPMNDDLDYSPGDLGPRFPTGGSLVGSVATEDFRRTSDGGYIHHIVFTDGSSIKMSSLTNGEGDKVSTVIIMEHGNDLVYSSRSVSSGDGQVLGHAVTGDPEGGKGSEAGDYYAAITDEENRQREETPSDGKPSGEKPQASDKPTGGKIDKFQPADGSSGTFCPMAIEICRRELARALASQETIFTGVIFVNPGEREVQPAAPRLVFNPQDLVINPDPDNISRDSNMDPRRFKMVIPVHVNPPGPSEE